MSSGKRPCRLKPHPPANEFAIEADRAFFSERNSTGIYPLAYAPHVRQRAEAVRPAEEVTEEEAVQ